MGHFLIPAFRVKDEDLAPVLKSLMGKAIDMGVPQPVINAPPPKPNGPALVKPAKAKRHDARSTKAAEGTLTDLFVAKQRSLGRTFFTRDDVNKFVDGRGASRAAAYYTVTKLMETGAIKTDPEGRGYIFTQPEPPKEGQSNV